MAWERIRSRVVHDYRIFRIREDRYQVPRTAVEHDFLVLECGDFVNVVALTERGEVVLIRQFRTGTRASTLEIPGGMMEAGEIPLESARRELREESGYESDTWISLGAIDPNPATHSNRCHTFLAEGARRVGELELDPGEDIAVELHPLAAVPALLASGAISHALVAVAFQKLELYRSGVLQAATDS